MTSANPHTILITGATGNIGSKLRAHLERKGRYMLRLLCLNPQDDPFVTFADLRDYGDWTAAFAGADAVVHLAIVPVPVLRWSRAHRDNIDMMLNVYHAAAAHQVPKVVLASSVWALYGRRFARGVYRPSEDDPGVSPYGLTKIFGERVGRAFAASHGIATIALRIGTCARKSNLPGKHMLTGAWGQSCWISNEDLCEGIEHAILAQGTSFAVLNMTSANDPVRWSLEETKAVTGYSPRNSHTARVGLLRKTQAIIGGIAFNFLPRVLQKLVPPFW